MLFLYGIIIIIKQIKVDRLWPYTMDHTILYSKLLINFNENEQEINISLLLVVPPRGGRVQCKMRSFIFPFFAIETFH